MRTLKLTVEYDGKSYVGWQRQRNGTSVQEVLERSLTRVLREQVTVTGAGRTDAGVHARGQVAHFATRSRMPLERMQKGANAVLPPDIVIRRVEEMPEGFHARYDARERVYRYLISTERTALERERCWMVFPKLHVGNMRLCAGMLKGTHDFRSFARGSSPGRNLRCTVRSAQWKRSGPFLIFEIRADRFVHGMVRALVGTMVDVGRGRWTVQEFRRILAGRNRTLAGVSAPPQGLVLEKVVY